MSVGSIPRAMSLHAPFAQPDIVRLDRAIWGLIALTAALLVPLSLIKGFYPVWKSFALPGASTTTLVIGAWFYAHIRASERIASALQGTAQIIAFAAVGAPYSYIVASLGWPLQDHALNAIDIASGINWRALLDWMNQHPALHPIFREAYMSFTPQASIAVLVLAFSGRLAWLRIFLLSFIVAALLCITISAFIPALGAWGYLGITPADHPDINPAAQGTTVDIVMMLRNGTLREFVAMGAEGIVTFPSLHAALAVILIVAFWPVPILRWAGLTINLLMLASTPIDGAHYFIDIFAGIALGGVALKVAFYVGYPSAPAFRQPAVKIAE